MQRRIPLATRAVSLHVLIDSETAFDAFANSLALVFIAEVDSMVLENKALDALGRPEFDVEWRCTTAIGPSVPCKWKGAYSVMLTVIWMGYIAVWHAMRLVEYMYVANKSEHLEVWASTLRFGV